MTVAADARAAVRAHPFLYTALEADIVNYTAAAEFLDVGETDAVAAALRRYADAVGDYGEESRRVSVTMRSGVGETDDGEGLLGVGGRTFSVGDGDLIAVIATGDVEPSGLEAVLGRLRTADIDPVAVGGTEGHAVVVVDRRSGPGAVRALEGALKGEQTTH